MPDSIESACQLANQVRFGREKVFVPQASPDRVSFGRKVLEQRGFSGLKISRELTPGIYKTLRRSCRRLNVPPERAVAYVHAESDLRAECFSMDGERCFIRLSSTLIERLDQDEVSFVMGHELGHFLLGHTEAPLPPADSLDHFSLLRAQELSCDRLGLLAAGEPEIAVRAIMKTLSGLTERHLRFDVVQFLRALDEDRATSFDPIEAYATHPSLPLRARCLVRFDAFWREYGGDVASPAARHAFCKLDQRIGQDFDRYSERATKTLTDGLLGSASSWIWLAAAVNDGRFDEQAQQRLESRFGKHLVDQACRNFSQMSASAVRCFVQEKAEEAMRNLWRASPKEAPELLQQEILCSRNLLLKDKQAHPLMSLLEGLDAGML